MRKRPRPRSVSGDGGGIFSGRTKPAVWSVTRSSIWEGVKSASATRLQFRRGPRVLDRVAAGLRDAQLIGEELLLRHALLGEEVPDRDRNRPGGGHVWGNASRRVAGRAGSSEGAAMALTPDDFKELLHLRELQQLLDLRRSD
jgi:hypothetical protein